MKVFVVGGAGYIGSHMVKKLLSEDYEVMTFDNLSTGYRDAVIGGEFVHGDLSDKGQVDSALINFKPDVVMHFASSIQVGESVRRPDIYYRNNFSNTLNLLDCMISQNISRFIFSSTAAIFGEPDYTPIDEAHKHQPLNPYGRSKWMVEQTLEDYEKAFGLQSVCLRYFNAAGADPDGMLGERHEPETHLIPLILQVASGRQEHIKIFGNDYDTPDGTCIRDYIHVTDLCNAHLLSIEYLSKGGNSNRFNLGNGNGFSVQEVISAVETITSRKIKIIFAGRRDGDPARLIADSRRVKSILGWQPQHSDLETIITHAWNWELKYNHLGSY